MPDDREAGERRPGAREGQPGDGDRAPDGRQPAVRQPDGRGTKPRDTAPGSGVPEPDAGYDQSMALHEVLESDRRAPREARHAIARFLEAARLPQLADDAELLTTELVTNAVRHAAGPIDVRAYVRDGFLRLEVADADVATTPSPRSAHPDDEGGRGMELVDKLSARWGWRTTGNSKVVWLDLPV